MTRLLSYKEANEEMETSCHSDERSSIVPRRKNDREKSEGDHLLSGSLDDVLTWLGWMGPYQRIQCLLLMLPVIDSALHSISFIFIGKFVEHKCAPLKEWISADNFSYPLASSNYTSYKQSSKIAVFAESCFVKVTNNSEEIFAGECPNGYVYSEPRDRSFVSEWDLVCDEEALSDTSQTVMAVGSMLGAFIFTAMADKLGRKPVYVVSHILLLVVAAATAFSPDFLTFMVFRFLLGALQQGVNLTSWILMIELIPALKREWPPRVSNFVWPSGLLLLGLICYLCREMSWRHTQLVLAAFSWYSLTDIPLEKGDSDKSVSAQEPEDDPGLTAFLKNKRILLITVIICYIWLADSLSYVILIITSDSLTGDFYLGYSLSIFVELPAACFFSAFVSRVKRRTWILTAHLIAGVSLVLAVVLGNVPQAAKLPGMGVIVLIMSLLAKFGTSVGFNILWLYTPELYPTTIRTTGLGLASLVSKLAGMAAPYARTLNRHYPWAPGAILSGLCLIVPLLLQLMPETHGRDLPQTVADMEMWLSEKPKKRYERMMEREGIENQAFQEVKF
ncbi:solute carrier family 22 member 6 [Elysia marginata]|uniref:Solute carrier family 22 member 6 n=1 Tax=Elysia marginata TaxID=1093978 RepID=A0AAV4HHW8_9GAST|nr:solute carrier family 22 member 6 [Elysia marginata]